MQTFAVHTRCLVEIINYLKLLSVHVTGEKQRRIKLSFNLEASGVGHVRNATSTLASAADVISNKILFPIRLGSLSSYYDLNDRQTGLSAIQTGERRRLTDVCTCVYVCVYVCMDGWMDGWMDGRTDDTQKMIRRRRGTGGRRRIGRGRRGIGRGRGQIVTLKRPYL